MQLTSSSFSHKQSIPDKFTCMGENVNPELIIKNIPEKAKCLVLIVDDPDALNKTFVHWVVFNIPLLSKIKENSVPGKQGINDYGVTDYKRPCPSSGQHRYYFKLYALDILLDLSKKLIKSKLRRKLQAIFLINVN